MAIATAMEPKPPHGGDGLWWGASALAGVGLDDASDDDALDELALLLGRLSESSSGKKAQPNHTHAHLCPDSGC